MMWKTSEYNIKDIEKTQKNKKNKENPLIF